MGLITRGSAPQNFVDFQNEASRALRLPTPEPQYWFAKMALGARLSLSALDAGVQTAQQFVSIAGGGSKLPVELDEMARASDAYPGAITAVDDFGKNKGDTIKFFRDEYVGGAYTEAGRKLAAGSAISTTAQAVQESEVPITLQEYVGPADANGNVAPFGVWSFDAKYRANKEQLANKVSRYLRRDYVKWLDRVIRNRFISDSGNSNITLPSSVSAVSAFAAGANAFVTVEQILNARKALSDREWQKFNNGRYVLVVPTSFNTQMLQDPDYRELSKTQTDGRNLLYGYIGSIQDVDIFEATTLATYAPSGQEFTTVNGVAAPTSTVLAEGLLFGPGTVGFGTAVSDQTGTVGPEVRFADDTNYGTVAKLIWYALHAFQTLDVRGVQRVVWQTA